MLFFSLHFLCLLKMLNIFITVFMTPKHKIDPPAERWHRRGWVQSGGQMLRPSLREILSSCCRLCEGPQRVQQLSRCKTWLLITYKGLALGTDVCKKIHRRWVGNQEANLSTYNFRRIIFLHGTIYVQYVGYSLLENKLEIRR